MTSILPIVIGALFTFLLALLAIIYNKLNKDITENSNDIKHIKEKYVTKEDFNRQNDKVEGKLDKIIDILMKRGFDEK